MTSKVNKPTTQELQSEVEIRRNEIKQYMEDYWPRLLMVGGVSVASYFIVKLIIKHLIKKR